MPWLFCDICYENDQMITATVYSIIDMFKTHILMAEPLTPHTIIG